MSTELQDVIDALVVIERAITAPSGEKETFEVYDEIPTSIATYPAFFNTERALTTDGASGLREGLWTFDVHLIFAPLEQKYSIRSRRRWVQAVINALHQHLTLGGTVSSIYTIQVDYEPVRFYDTDYLAANFEIDARLYESYAFAG